MITAKELMGATVEWGSDPSYIDDIDTAQEWADVINNSTQPDRALSPGDDDYETALQMLGLPDDCVTIVHTFVNGSVGHYRLDSEVDQKQAERRRIGCRIAELRKEQGYTTRQLAEMAGITQANLCNIENGKYSAGFDILQRIAAALGSSVTID